MRPIIIGILLFLAWLILSTWYYTNHIYPVFNPAEDTDITEEVETSVGPAPETQEAPAALEAPEAITLYFEFDKTEILNPIEFQDFIPAGKAFLKANPDVCITITGHTCDIGTQAYNMGLGKRRAESARTYLKTNGLSPDCLEVVSKGESEPAVANTSEENRQRNRRVTIDMNR
jgi:outer membrane protein OmpA-like peptidoglycan-associated protein